MTWYGIAVLILIVVGISALMKVLYGQKDGPTPCIGCGACIGTGECVMRREELKRRKKVEEIKANCKNSKVHKKFAWFSSVFH